jgi:hypothetical protein
MRYTRRRVRSAVSFRQALAILSGHPGVFADIVP